MTEIDIPRLRFLVNMLEGFEKVEAGVQESGLEKAPSFRLLNPGLAYFLDLGRERRKELEDNVLDIARRLLEEIDHE